MRGDNSVSQTLAGCQDRPEHTRVEVVQQARNKLPSSLWVLQARTSDEYKEYEMVKRAKSFSTGGREGGATCSNHLGIIPGAPLFPPQQ